MAMTMVRSGWDIGCGYDYGEEWVGHGMWP